MYKALIQEISPDNFQATPDAKSLPDDCDYTYLFNAYQKSKVDKPFERKVYKVTIEQGKLVRSERTDVLPYKPQTSEPTTQLSGIQNIE